MFSKIISLSVLLIISNAQLLPVSLYYESLCPGSAKFVVEELEPTMRSSLGRYLQLELIPFGNANITSQTPPYTFVCQHGPVECYGNKVQSCALKYISDDSLNFIRCVMEKILNGFVEEHNVYPGLICATELSIINWDAIERCSNSTEGDELLAENGRLTIALPEKEFVPWVVFNEQSSFDNANLALADFHQAICSNMNKPLPQECIQYSVFGP